MNTLELFHAGCTMSEIRTIARAKIKVCSNCRELIYPPAYIDHARQRRSPVVHHLSNGWGPTSVEPHCSVPDASLYVLQDASLPELKLFWKDSDYYLTGPILEREKTASDRRYTIYGTGGLLTKILPGALEDLGISCLHATSVYNPATNHLMVFIGGPGAGKTILMLEACLRRGYRLVTTEYTHFTTTNGEVRFYPGSVFDNVRAANLVYNYPEYKNIWGEDILGPFHEESNLWNVKVALDMTPLRIEQEEIVNPEISLVFVKIEGQRECAVVDALSAPATRFRFYLNASELINRPRLFYDSLPVASFDNMEKARQRLRIVNDFLSTAALRECTSLFAGVNNAWIWD